MSKKHSGSDPIDVLVVGAGPTGLTMAAELERHGLRCRLIDKRDGALDNSRALAIQARTLEHFDLMGVIDPFLARGCQVYSGSFWSGEQRLARVEIKGLDTPYPFMLDLPQNQTEEILRDRLASTTSSPTGAWSLSPSDRKVRASPQRCAGRPARRRRSRCRAVIGCDGAHSTTRHTLGWDFGGSSMDALFAVGDMRIDWALPHEEMKVFLHEAGLLFGLPVRRRSTPRRRRARTLCRRGPASRPTLADFQAGSLNVAPPGPPSPIRTG